MDEFKGDGYFRWYVAHSEEAEAFDASASTKHEALQKGLAKYGTHPFCLIEADKMLPSFDIFDATSVMREFEEENETCWGEDGMELELEPELEASLRKALEEALHFWMWRNDCIPPVWSVANYRTIEWVNSVADADHERAQEEAP